MLKKFGFLTEKFLKYWKIFVFESQISEKMRQNTTLP